VGAVLAAHRLEGAVDLGVAAAEARLDALLLVADVERQGPLEVADDPLAGGGDVGGGGVVAAGGLGGLGEEGPDPPVAGAEGAGEVLGIARGSDRDEHRSSV